MSSYTQWIPFDLACRLHCLQQGSLNIGNTQQNRLNLLSICTTEANAGANFAKWDVLQAAGTSPRSLLLVKAALVPGFVKPVAS